MGFAHRNDTPYEEAAAPVSVAPPQNDEPVGPARSPTGSLTEVPIAEQDGSKKLPSGPVEAGVRGRDRDLQLVFTNVLLSVVGAYGVTGSVAVTVIAAVIALLVTAVVARLR